MIQYGMNLAAAVCMFLRNSAFVVKIFSVVRIFLKRDGRWDHHTSTLRASQLR